MQQDDTSPVRTAPSASGPDLQCAGRESELARLTSLYRDAQRGDPSASRLVLVEGPSGIGKSRLLAELRSRVRLQGGVVLEGRCEAGRAFGPFAEIVDRALRFLDEVGVAPEIDLAGLACADGCHRLWHQHRGDPELSAARGGPRDLPARGGPRDLPARGGPRDLPARGGPREAAHESASVEKRLRFFDAIAALLREVARVRAPVVLLDHLEAADHGTLALIAFLLEGAGVVPRRGDELRALFVASLRREDGVECPEGVRALHARAARVEMGVLDLEGVRAYLQSERALARILERTGGHPEAIELLLEGAPLTAEERLRRRLDALPATSRALMEALSVLGRPATLDELSAVAGVEPTPQERATAAACDLLGRSVIDGRILFAFERAADVERCYRQLEPERQRALHARAADVCGQSVDLQEAVRHALAAGEHARASDLAVIAAASLSARHGHAEAAALLESFLAAVPDAAPAIREQLAELYRVTGEYPRALVHARIVWAAAPDDPRAAHRVGQLLTMAGEHDEAAEILLAAVQRAGGAGDRAELEAQLAELHYQRADYAQATTWAERALGGAASIGDPVIEVQARNVLGKVALAQKDPRTAAALFVENRDQAQRTGLGHQEAQAHTNHAIALLLQRDLPAAERACHTAIEVAARVGDTRERAVATETLAVIAHFRRHYGDALRHYREAVALLKRLGNRAMLAGVANNLGELYLAVGERRRARAMYEFASRVGGHDLPMQLVGERLLLGGRIQAAEGNTRGARDTFHQTRDIFAELGSVRSVDVTLELARIAVDDGDVAGARVLLTELPRELAAQHRADVAVVSAEIERAAGGDARAAGRRAVELAEACDDAERLQSALVRYARALGDAGEVGLATCVLERAQQIEDALTVHVPDESRAAWVERRERRELDEVATSLNTAWTRTRHESVPPPPALMAVAGEASRDGSSLRHAARPDWRKKYPRLVGSSDALASIFHVLDKVAPSDALVLVRGESGTGKELIADAIHANSPRRNKPLVKVNCAALVETLLLSELFGHERGAFTGASARKKGRFELADGGTIFLDEIGDISPKTQMALLRVLQERTFERVGGTQAIKVDVRIVAATHRDLEQMVRDGTFREDLYYRLRGVSVDMPPLRDRLADLPALADHLLARIADERGEAKKTLGPAALQRLGQHRWPGNVRELENVLRSATLFADESALVPEDFAAFAEVFALPEAPATSEASGAPRAIESLVYERIKGGAASLLEMKKMMERECIQRALDDTNGNITHAAALLGMKRPRLSQLVKQYQLKAVE